MAYKIVIEKYRFSHKPGPVKSEERIEIPLPAQITEEMALERLRVLAAVLEWPIASRSDEPPALYVSNNAKYGIYVIKD